VEKIVKHPFVLEDYQLSAVTERRDALGEARVLISDGTGTYRGRGVSTDVIEASILACLAGVNAMLGSAQSALGTGAAADAQRSAIK
jgi:2-isopropylmalate synthase